MDVDVVRAIQRCRREGWRVQPLSSGLFKLSQGGARLRLTKASLLKFAFGTDAAA